MVNMDRIKPSEPALTVLFVSCNNTTNHLEYLYSAGSFYSHLLGRKRNTWLIWWILLQDKNIQVLLNFIIQGCAIIIAVPSRALPIAISLLLTLWSIIYPCKLKAQKNIPSHSRERTGWNITKWVSWPQNKAKQKRRNTVFLMLMMTICVGGLVKRL